MQICLDSPLPTLDGILAAFKPLLAWPPKLAFLPPLLPCLPSPLFPSFTVPNFELVLHALELQAFQLQNTIMGMIKPILDKLGIALDSFLPKIPGLPELTLLDLLDGNVDKIILAVRNAILRGFRLPMLPYPLYVTIQIPDFEVIQTMQIIMANYMQMVAALIPNLIKKVTDKFKWPGLPAIPSLPTIEDIIALIALRLPGLPPDPSLADIFLALKLKIMDKYGNFDIMGFLIKLVFPGFPALPFIPVPLVFSFAIPDIDFVMGLNALYTHLTTAFLKPIMDFITKTLSKFLSFTFPKLCINIPIPAIPPMPTTPSLPKVPKVTMPKIG